MGRLLEERMDEYDEETWEETQEKNQRETMAGRHRIREKSDDRRAHQEKTEKTNKERP